MFVRHFDKRNRAAVTRINQNEASLPVIIPHMGILFPVFHEKEPRDDAFCQRERPSRIFTVDNLFQRDTLRHMKLLSVHSSTLRHRLFPRRERLSRAKILAMAKRTLQVNVHMSNEDLALLRKAAGVKWPEIEFSNSTLVLTLAREFAKQIVPPTRERKTK